MEEEIIRVAHIVGKMVGGGVESFLLNYYKYIDKSKIQFDFIIDKDSTQIPRDEIEKYGGRIILVPPYQNIYSYIKELKEILYVNKYKIVHSHLNALSVFPLFAAYMAKVPVRIAHSHSTTNKKEWKKNIIKNILKPFSKVFATHYFACSEHAAEWLFGKKNKKVIINNAIDLNKFKRNIDMNKKIRKKLNLENKFVIGHIGRFVEQKNHEYLIAVFEKVLNIKKNAILLLAGDGPLKDKIENLIIEKDLKNDVVFLGNIGNVNEVIQCFDVFLLPSLYEGLGIVAVEAQAIGCKCVLSSNVPKEAVVNKNVYKFDIDKCSIQNWVEKASSCEQIENNEIIFKQMTLRGYNIEVEVKKLEDIYVNLTNEERGKKCSFI